MNSFPSSLDTWVLAGQSNMQGYGLLADAMPSDERVWSFTSAGRWEIAEDPLIRCWESFTPVHQAFNREGLTEMQKDLSNETLAKLESETRVCGAGLGISFGAAMADALGKPIGLIPAAHGGTSLDQWSPCLKDQGGHSLYGAMLERIQRAGGRLRGMLWYQGESDTMLDLASTYRERFKDFIQALRSDTGIPDLPVIAVQIGRVITNVTEGWPAEAWDDIREAQLFMPDDVPNSALTSAVDLDLSDGIHIGGYGMIRLGRRMARLALSLTDCPAIPSGPRVERLELIPYTSEMDAVKVVCSGVTGKWQSCHGNIRGFEVRTPDNKPHPIIRVVNAAVDKEDPTAIRVIVGCKDDDSFSLGYGLGADPCCNAVDEADMPLGSFWPRKVGKM